MSIAEIKSNIYQLIDKVENDNFLVQVQEILKEYFLDELVNPNDISDELRTKLNAAAEDSKAGRTTSHEVIKNNFRQKYAHFYES